MNGIGANENMGIHLDKRLRCGVCGFSELRTDEVVDRDVLFLAECPRCEHRWTSLQPLAVDASAARALATARFQRVAARLTRELQTAA